MDYEDIMVALKNGNVPDSGVQSICLGRENEIEEFKKLLNKIQEDEKAYCKFINGEFGAGKSFFLKVIEEMAFENNFVVSWITLGNDIPFNKIDIVYKNIAKTLKCKTGTSLDHIIDRWITGLKMMAFEETTDPQQQNKHISESIRADLSDVRHESNAFASAIENYNRLMNEEDYKTANYALAWLRGDSNIPFTEKRKFGVKGGVTKENALDYLKALSSFVKSVGYSGLVILVDEAEFIMNLHGTKLRDISYNYIRDIYDECSMDKFHNSLFVFAGTPELYEDPKIGIPSYKALNDRLLDALEYNDGDIVDTRKPIIELKGFTKEQLVQIAGKLSIMHAEAYKWNSADKINPVLNKIVEIHENNAKLTGGKVNPRIFVRSFISVLDTVQQNQSFFTKSEDILSLFEKTEPDFDDWGDNWDDTE